MQKMKTLKNSPVKFIPEGHRYMMPDGSFVKSSLTAMLRKWGLCKSLEGIPEHILNKAAERGTRIHAECEMWDKYRIEPTHEWAKPYVDLGLDVIESEFLVNYGNVVATQIDKVIYNNKDRNLTVADIKTTSKVDLQGVTWQTNIGAYMLECQTGEEVGKCICIWLRDSNAEIIELERIARKDISALLQAEKENTEDFVPVKLKQNNLPEMLEEKAVEISAQLFIFKQIEQRLKDFKAEVLQYMINEGIEKMQTLDGKLHFTLVGEHFTTRFDQKKALEEIPDLSKYLTKSKVKASLKMY